MVEEQVASPSFLLKYGQFGQMDVATIAPTAQPFSTTQYERLTSLVNVALHNTLTAWLDENVRMYVAGLALYTVPGFGGPALFDVLLDAVGPDIK